MSVSPLKSRIYLAELNPNGPAVRQPLKRKLGIPSPMKLCVSALHILTFPSEIVEEIFEYLECRELITAVQYVCRDWSIHANSRGLWQRLAQARTLESNWLVKRTACMVERRSKGKLFSGVLRTTGEPVSLKKVRLDVTNAGHDDGVPTSLLREVSYLTTLKHANVAKLHFAEVQKDSVLLCIEHTAFNFQQYLKPQKPSLELVRSVMRQVFQGLDYIHHCGVMHRNLKPDNVLVDSSGAVKLADFTLARMCVTPHVPYTPEDPKERERSGRESRRLWYRAPELLVRKELYSYEVDVWAAGCLLAEAASGEPLFNAETEIEQLFRIFKLTGSPGSDLYPSYAGTFPKWDAVGFASVLFPPSSLEYQRACSVMVPARENGFQRLIQIGTVIGPMGLDLLQRCLDINPTHRISAAAALQHPFFNEGVRYVHAECDLFTYRCASECQMKETLARWKLAEMELALGSDYLARQTEVNEIMRAILVDWLVDVSVHFELMDETLHLGISYIDRVLAETKIEKSKLQLLGVACMKVADVYNERSKEYYRQDNSAEYAYITADEYQALEVVQMEKLVLNQLKFRLQSPTVVHFVKLYQRVLELEHSTNVLQLVSTTQYLADLTLLVNPCAKFPQSLVAAAVVFLACFVSQTAVSGEKVRLCGALFPAHSLASFQNCVSEVRQNWVAVRSVPQFTRFEAVNKKFESKYHTSFRDLAPGAVPLGHCEHWWFSPY